MNQGIPTNDRAVESYLQQLEKTNGLLIYWLEEFKSKFAQYSEAKSTMEEVENALKLYKEKTEAVRIPLAIKKAKEARKADGSVLEYGLDYHLKRFTDAVRKFQEIYTRRFIREFLPMKDSLLAT